MAEGAQAGEEMLAGAAAIPGEESAAGGLFVVGMGEAQVERGGGEIGGDGGAAGLRASQAQPVPAVGEGGSGLEGRAGAGAVDVEGVALEPGGFFAQEGGGVGAGDAVGQDDLDAAAGMDVEGGASGAGGAADGIGGGAPGDEDGVAGARRGGQGVVRSRRRRVDYGNYTTKLPPARSARLWVRVSVCRGLTG